MKKTIRLTESELQQIVESVLNKMENNIIAGEEDFQNKEEYTRYAYKLCMDNAAKYIESAENRGLWLDFMSKLKEGFKEQCKHDTLFDTLQDDGINSAFVMGWKMYMSKYGRWCERNLSECSY